MKSLSSRIVFLACLLSVLSACSLTQLKTSEATEAPSLAPEALPIIPLDPECLISHEEIDALPAHTNPDIWDRIRDGYALPEIHNKRVDQQLKWYAKNSRYMERVGKRGERYLFHIVNEIEKRNMPMEIALLPIVESAFDPFAYSHGRASGIWQIIPGTGKGLGLKQNWWYDGRRDVTASTDAALTYLQQLHKRFDGDWLLALAAYNSGGGTVNKAIRKNKKKGKPTDFWHLALPRETRAYVPKLLALAHLVKNPTEYGQTLHSVPNEAYFASVETGSQIDLAHAAELAEIDMDVLYHLNPGFNRWATDPKGPHALLVPVDKAEKFALKLEAIPDNSRVTWDRYTIKSGDSLSTIAAKHKISVSSLKAINELKNNRIRAGKTLMVPVAARPDQHYSYTQTQRLAKRRASSAKKQSGNKINYVVKQGDSFWSIAKKYGVRSTKIARWNNMGLRDPIKPGQTLVIWTKAPTLASNGSGKQMIRKVSYKVRNGDSLHRIADKFQLRVKDIMQWNQIDPSKYLQPGQSLTLYVDVTNSADS